MSEIQALGYVGLRARDLAAWRTFASGFLGLEAVGDRGDETLRLRMDDNDWRISVEAADGDDIAFAGWQVADARALASLAARVRECGVQVTDEPQALAAMRGVLGLVSFDDPDGLRIEAFFGPLVHHHQPFLSPRAIGGFVTGDQGVGHIVLATSDLQRQLDFYGDVLGFRISDYIDVVRAGTPLTFAFMHCSPRHHSLAFASRPPEPRRLLHLMLQVHTIDDVGRTYSLAEESGYEIAATLGRHTNDDMFSFYVKTPSGWEIEYGFGALEVDDATWRIERHDRTSVWGHRREPLPKPSV
jgi:2,3-dihydroxybiphenyl 1,2-dioxygenase